MENKQRLIDAYTFAEEIESLQITVAGKPARWNDAKHSVLRKIAEQPTVDAVEVVHGRWDEYDCYKCDSNGKPVIKTGKVFVCSVCGREERFREPYCHCGAKMDGDANA